MIKLADLSMVELERLRRNIKMRMFHYSIFDSQYTNLCRQAEAVKNEINERYRIYLEQPIGDVKELMKYEEDMKIIERRYTPYETRKTIKDVIQNKKEGRKMNNLYVTEVGQRIKLNSFKAEMEKRTQEEKNEMFEKFKEKVTPSESYMVIKPNFKFERGYIVPEGMKMYLECPVCKELHEVAIGQNYILNPDNKDNYNQCCIYKFEDWDTANIFKPTMMDYVYSDSKYCLHDDECVKNNIDLDKSLAKVIGEVLMENWDLNDDPIEIFEGYMKSVSNRKYIVHKEDIVTLIHLAYRNIPLDNFYIIDNDLNIEKLNSLDFVLRINNK